MSEARRHESYLGDGAYVYLDQSGCVVLYTSNGVEETNHVVLDSEVLELFLAWINGVQGQCEREAT